MSWRNIYEKFDEMIARYNMDEIDDRNFINFLTTLSRMCESFLNDGKVNYYELILTPVLNGLESDNWVFKNQSKTIVRRVGTYLERSDFMFYPFALDFLENVYNHGGETYMTDYFKVISKKLKVKYGKKITEEYRFLSGSDKYYKKNKINYKDEYIFREF